MFLVEARKIRYAAVRQEVFLSACVSTSKRKSKGSQNTCLYEIFSSRTKYSAFKTFFVIHSCEHLRVSHNLCVSGTTFRELNKMSPKGQLRCCWIFPWWKQCYPKHSGFPFWDDANLLDLCVIVNCTNSLWVRVLFFQADVPSSVIHAYVWKSGLILLLSTWVFVPVFQFLLPPNPSFVWGFYYLSRYIMFDLALQNTPQPVAYCAASPVAIFILSFTCFASISQSCLQGTNGFQQLR